MNFQLDATNIKEAEQNLMQVARRQAFNEAMKASSVVYQIGMIIILVYLFGWLGVIIPVAAYGVASFVFLNLYHQNWKNVYKPQLELAKRQLEQSKEREELVRRREERVRKSPSN